MRLLLTALANGADQSEYLVDGPLEIVVHDGVVEIVDRRQLRDRIVEQQLSVRAAEELTRPRTRAPSRRAQRTPRDPNLQRVADSLRERLQTRVRLNGDAARGRIEIEYFGAEDLQRIAGILIGDA